MRKNKSKIKKENIITNLFKHTEIITFLIVFIMLFITLLGFYPGLVSYDGNSQWQQVQSGIISDSHPFFSTFFMLLLSKIWNSVTIVLIYQIILFSIAWGYFCKSIKIKEKNKQIIACIFTCLVTLCPLTSLFGITLWKDIIYTIYLFLCAILLYEWAGNNYDLSFKKYCLLGIFISMVFSYRHNGIIVAILMLIIFYILNIRKYKKNIIDKKIFKKSFIVLISFVVVVGVIAIPKKIILEESSKKLKEEMKDEVSYSVVDSYMLWMMGAHIKAGNIDNAKDKEFLNKIIPLDEWKNAYNPYLINGTGHAKNFDKKYLVENSSKFENLFIKYSIKNPGTIIKHYLRADALLFNPLSSIHGYVYVYCFPEMGNLPEYTKIKPVLPVVNWFYTKLANFSSRKPFNIFYEPAFILYLSIIIVFILSKKVYGKKIWLFALPMILNIVSLTPINLAQDLRYVYINYFTFYGLVLLAVLNYKKIIIRKKHKKK